MSEQADHRHRGLLCARSERPCRRTTDDANDLPPSHSRLSFTMKRPDYQMISERALWQLLHRDREFRIGSRATFERRPLFVCCTLTLLTESLQRRELEVCAISGKNHSKLRRRHRSSTLSGAV